MQYINVKEMVEGEIEKISSAIRNLGHEPKALYIISVGEDPASKSYMKGKIRDCERCGIPWRHREIPAIKGCGTLIKSAILDANLDESVRGIILQLPLPRELFSETDEKRFTDMIAPEKDVDGFVAGSHFKPCTPEGIVWLMKQELGEDLSGKRALIAGRGKLVGRPLYDLLQYGENMSVMQCGSHEKDLDALVLGPADGFWDAVITAVGKPNLVNLGFVEDGLVIDAGISRTEEGKLCGDCYGFDKYAFRGLRVTPVPGGVGLVTRMMLMRHMLEAQNG